jgi:hypothetical protein
MTAKVGGTMTDLFLIARTTRSEDQRQQADRRIE